MLTVTVILSLATSIMAQDWLTRTSAASDAQIRFAIENKYDGTGPGAKTPEYAYKTYRTLDEALVAYVDDPDTQLPEREKNQALYKLSRPSYNSIPQAAPVPRYQPKTVDEYTGYNSVKNIPAHYRPQNLIQTNNVPTDYTGWKFDNTFYKPRTILRESTYPRHHSFYGFGAFRNNDQPALNDNTAGQEVQDFDPNPQYTFSYGVHDKGTGDSKSAHESRDGGTVKGFYTFLDADGKQRTVHYTADDKLGFRANVQRTHTNTQ